MPQSPSVRTRAQLCPSHGSRGRFHRSGTLPCKPHPPRQPQIPIPLSLPNQGQLSAWQFAKGLQAESQGECRTHPGSFLSRKSNSLVMSVVKQGLKTVAPYISSTLIAVWYGKGGSILIFLSWMEAEDSMSWGQFFLAFVVCVLEGWGRERPALLALLRLAK